MNLILASSSPFRKQLLQRLRLPFQTVNPDIDESPLEGESHEAMVVRLACEKARLGAGNRKETLCIGADTIASFNGEILGKPLNHDTAVLQLKKMSGKEVVFLTGICVYSAALKQSFSAVVPTYVKFRPLSEQTIEQYLKLEQPYQSSGSFKSETTGCALIEYSKSDDPTAIMGLPLIMVCEFMRKAGLPV